MASKKGAPTQESANKLRNYEKQSRSTPVTWTDVKPLTEEEKRIYAGHEDEAFRLKNSLVYPTRPIPTDERADMYNMRQEMVQAGQITSARPLPYTEGEMQYLIDRNAAEEYAAYNQWIANRYDINDPPTRAMLKQMIPRYFEQRKAVLEEQMADHARYARLVFDGPDSEEDLMFQWTVETGRRHIPTGPFYNPFQWMLNETDQPNATDRDSIMAQVAAKNADAYTYGMFNPFQPSTAKQAGWGPNPLNASDIIGNPNNRTYGFAGAHVPTDGTWSWDYGARNVYGGRNEPAISMNSANTIATNPFALAAGYNRPVSSVRASVGAESKPPPNAHITNSKRKPVYYPYPSARGSAPPLGPPPPPPPPPVVPNPVI